MIKEKSSESDLLNISDVCDALAVARSTFYRRTADKTNAPEHEKKSSSRKLSEQEEESVLAVLTSERFCDFAPARTHATLVPLQNSVRIIKSQIHLKSKEIFEEPDAGNLHVWFCGGGVVNWITPLLGDNHVQFNTGITRLKLFIQIYPNISITHSQGCQMRCHSAIL